MTPAASPLTSTPQSCYCGFPPKTSPAVIEKRVRDIFEYLLARAQNPTVKVKPLAACDAEDKANPALRGDGTIKIVGRPDFIWDLEDNASAAVPTPSQMANGVPGTVRFGFQACAVLCSEDAVAAIIGHELGHLALKHGRRAEAKFAKLPPICQQSDDCVRPAMACVRTSAESQADAAAVVYLNCSQYSVRKGIKGMASIQDYYWVHDIDMDKKVQDHPAPAQRIRDMQATLDTLSPKCDE